MLFTTRAIYAGTWTHNFHDRVFRDRDCQPRQTGHAANHCRINAAAHLRVTHSRGSAGVSCAYRMLLPDPPPAAVVALLLLLGVAIGAYHMPYKLALISACNGCVRVGNIGRRRSELACSVTLARTCCEPPLPRVCSALYGAWPICLIVFAAVFLFDLCTVTGHFEVVKYVRRAPPQDEPAALPRTGTLAPSLAELLPTRCAIASQ